MRNRMLLLGAIAILVAAPALAFHDSGVATCNGCHTMHNSQNGSGMNFAPGEMTTPGGGTAVGQGYTDLLLYPNASDVCLRCHGNNSRGYNVFESDPLAPTASEYYSAGNFVFLLENNLNDGYMGATYVIGGEKAGHNIQSGIKGSVWDTTLTAPPGVASPLTNNNLHCSSCHDPHGNSSFRLLYRGGQQVDVGPVGAADTVTFAATIMAEGIAYDAVESDASHNAYISGYSDWCASCHTGFHNAAGNLIHPSGSNLTTAVVAKYNAYRGTVDCVGTPPSGGNPCGTGTATDAYLADVPFEDAAATTTSTAGPTTASTVACVTCHRAHATSAPDAGRWDFNLDLLADDGVESGSWAIPRTYNDADQRSLCNKCHTQDEYDHVTPVAP
jgi:hypothetical protein